MENMIGLSQGNIFQGELNDVSRIGIPDTYQTEVSGNPIPETHNSGTISGGEFEWLIISLNDVSGIGFPIPTKLKFREIQFPKHTIQEQSQEENLNG